MIVVNGGVGSEEGLGGGGKRKLREDSIGRLAKDFPLSTGKDDEEREREKGYDANQSFF